MPLPFRRTSSNRVDKVQRLLASRGLTFAQVYRASRSPGLHPPLWPIPHNFRSSLRKPGFSPSLYHVFTLTKLTGYSLADWLAVFGFSLDDVPRFHASFPALRTVELDARVYDANRSIPWFTEMHAADFRAPLMPLTRWLELTTPRTLHPIRPGAKSGHRFVKIGSQDAFAFPDLIPGSIVRTRLTSGPKYHQRGRNPGGRLVLVEHGQGLICTRLGRSTAGKIVLCSRHLPYAPVELQEGTEAFVRGTVDLEIRPLGHIQKPVVPWRLARFWTPAPLVTTRAKHVGEFIRRARTRSGLSFREASQRTRRIARTLRDARYYCAPGSLSDFETKRHLPRNIHKVISICAVYFASPAEMMEVAGVPLEKAGTLPIPAEFSPKRSSELLTSKQSAFFKAMETRHGRVPYFLSSALAGLFGLPDFSPRDVFWAGGLRGAKHSGMEGACFLALDRKQKVPRPSLSSPAWQQPLYVLLLRDGTYLSGFCSLQNGFLILRPCGARLPKLLRFRNRVEAEVVGRVVGTLRKLR